MKSMFEKSTSDEMINRINQLTSDLKPEWGKMSVDQMVVHAQQGFKTAFGDLKLKRGLIGVLFGGIAKKQLISNKPFGKNLPTDKSFIIKNHPEFETERRKLIQLLERFVKDGPGGLTSEPHPFFGKMSPAEWDVLMYKHLDHHLRQFGK